MGAALGLVYDKWQFILSHMPYLLYYFTLSNARWFYFKGKLLPLSRLIWLQYGDNNEYDGGNSDGSDKCTV
jgi:hypothetical protein